MNRRNSKKANFISSINTCSLDDTSNDLAKRCKFNFSYFVGDQEFGRDFSELTELQSRRLLEKLKDYSKEKLTHWKSTPIGRKSGHVLEIYGGFPAAHKTRFSEPKHTPHQALWGRFRLDNDTRLVGFIIPDERHRCMQSSSDELFDSNTFYIVFYDNSHSFYIPNT